MIRQSPEVPAAVELADVARHIMNTEFTFQDPAFNQSWRWQSPGNFDPHLSVIVSDLNARMMRGRMIFTHVLFGILDGSTEYRLEVPVV